MWRKQLCRLSVAAIGVVVFSSLALASELWKIQTKNYTDFLVRDGKQRFELPASNVTPKVLQIKTHANFEVVIYLANTSGTSEMFSTYMGAIYSRTDKKIIATLAYKYKNVDPNGDHGPQPKWVFKKDGSISVASVDFPKKPRIFRSKKK